MAFRNVLVISPRTPSNPDWDKFLNDVRMRNMEPPISLPRPPIAHQNVTVSFEHDLCIVSNISNGPSSSSAPLVDVQCFNVVPASGSDLRGPPL